MKLYLALALLTLCTLVYGKPASSSTSRSDSSKKQGGISTLDPEPFEYEYSDELWQAPEDDDDEGSAPSKPKCKSDRQKKEEKSSKKQKKGSKSSKKSKEKRQQKLKKKQAQGKRRRNE